MSLAAQIALSVAAGLLVAALAHLLGRRRRPAGWAGVAGAAIVFAYVGTTAFEMLHDSWPAHEGRTVNEGVMLAVGLALAAYAVRELIVNWRDEDRLADLYGSQQGYIARPERLSPRIKAVLFVTLFGGLFAVGAFSYLQSLFFPE